MRTLDLKILKGNTKKYTLIFRNKDKTYPNISSWTVYFTVKKNLADSYANAKIKKVITQHTNPTRGQTAIMLTSIDTDLLGSYLYDITVKNNEMTTILMGKIQFDLSVTDGGGGG